MKVLSVLFLLVFQVAYAQDHNHGQKMEKKAMSHEHGKENKQFNAVLGEYEKLHSEFFDNNLEKIKEQAKMVNQSISKIEDKEILKLLTFTQKKLTLIENSDDMEKSREAMGVVSQGMINVLEKHANNKNYAGYYCPMVKKYWIQNIEDSDKVRNPYASTTMPSCGSRK